MATKKQVELKKARGRQDRHKALSHALRVEILSIIAERTASPVEMARELDETVGNVSHHVKQLVKYGCAEKVAERQVRGATEHFYKATVRPLLDVEEWSGLNAGTKTAISMQACEKVIDDMNLGLAARTIDTRPDRILSRFPMVLDEPGWEEVRAAFTVAFEAAFDAQQRSDERRVESGDEGIRASASLLFFELP